jgi:hypothetical protein
MFFFPFRLASHRISVIRSVGHMMAASANQSWRRRCLREGRSRALVLVLVDGLTACVTVSADIALRRQGLAV